MRNNRVNVRDFKESFVPFCYLCRVDGAVTGFLTWWGTLGEHFPAFFSADCLLSYPSPGRVCLCVQRNLGSLGLTSNVAVGKPLNFSELLFSQLLHRDVNICLLDNLSWGWVWKVLHWLWPWLLSRNVFKMSTVLLRLKGFVEWVSPGMAKVRGSQDRVKGSLFSHIPGLAWVDLLQREFTWQILPRATCILLLTKLLALAGTGMK